MVGDPICSVPHAITPFWVLSTCFVVLRRDDIEPDWVFRLVPAGDNTRTFLFCANSIADKNQWIAALLAHGGREIQAPTRVAAAGVRNAAATRALERYGTSKNLLRVGQI